MNFDSCLKKQSQMLFFEFMIAAMDVMSPVKVLPNTLHFTAGNVQKRSSSLGLAWEHFVVT